MAELPDPLPEYRFSDLSWTAREWMLRDDESDKWILDAPYQRGSVWDLDRRRNLIRSLLIGLPVGSVVYAKLPYRADVDRPTAMGRVVDGKQRVETIRAFVAGEFTVPAWWFDPRNVETRAGDVTYADLTRRGRMDIVSAKLPGLEFESFRYTVPNPDYDPELRPGAAPKGDPRYRTFLWKGRTRAEALQVEAEVFLLINFGGVEQTDEHRAHVEGMTR